MNRFVALVIFLSFNIAIYAQYSDSELREIDCLSIGLEKNNSVWIDYGFNKGFHINYKHTAIADELSRQSWRIGILHTYIWQNVHIGLNPFVTSDWYRSFVNVGCSFKFRKIWDRDICKIGIEYLPYYDNDLRFQNGWAVAAQVKICNDISAFVEYGRKPDYRIAYKRGYIGWEIKVANLYVKPMLEIPIYDSGVRFDHSKIVINSYYTFKI